MKRILLAALIALAPASAFARTAASVVDGVANALTAAKTASAEFRISDPNAGTYTGSIDVKGDRFAFKTAHGSVVYDGKTQWTVDPGVKEVSIYEPTADEVMQINPFAVIRGCKAHYTAKLLSESGSNARIELTPKDKASSIKKIVLDVDTAKNEPKAITMALDDGSSLRIDITSLRMGVNLAANKFVINTKEYPGFDIVDLR